MQIVRCIRRRVIPLTVAGLIVGGCAGFPSTAPTRESQRSAVLEAEVARSVEIRLAHGLQADQAWVTAVVTDPTSPTRFGIRVTAAEALAIDEEQVADAIEFRKSVGMRADEPWVWAVQSDPRAVSRYGIAVSRDEAAALDDRIRVQLDVAPAIQAYGESHPDVWAGLYIEERTGVIVASFTDEVETHRAALLALFAPGVARLEVRRARWSSAQLDEWNARLWTAEAQDWLRSIGAMVVGGGSRVRENDVLLEVRVPAPDAGLGARIASRFDAGAWLRVDVQVSPAMNLPFGRLEVQVVDSAKTPIEGVQCWLVPDLVGAAGDSTIRDTDPDGICRWDALRASGYAIEIRDRHGRVVLATDRAEIAADSTARVEIAIGVQ